LNKRNKDLFKVSLNLRLKIIFYCAISILPLFAVIFIIYGKIGISIAIINTIIIGVLTYLYTIAATAPRIHLTIVETKIKGINSVRLNMENKHGLYAKINLIVKITNSKFELNSESTSKFELKPEATENIYLGKENFIISGGGKFFDGTINFDKNFGKLENEDWLLIRLEAKNSISKIVSYYAWKYEKIESTISPSKKQINEPFYSKFNGKLDRSSPMTSTTGQEINMQNETMNNVEGKFIYYVIREKAEETIDFEKLREVFPEKSLINGTYH